MTPYPPAPLAVSLGDPAGIGAEVLAKCWDNRGSFDLPPFVAIGDPRAIAAVWDGPLAIIDDPQEADPAFDVGRAEHVELDHAVVAQLADQPVVERDEPHATPQTRCAASA